MTVVTGHELGVLRELLAAEGGTGPGVTLEPLPDVVPSDWYDYELDELEGTNLEELKKGKKPAAVDAPPGGDKEAKSPKTVVTQVETSSTQIVEEGVEAGVETGVASEQGLHHGRVAAATPRSGWRRRDDDTVAATAAAAASISTSTSTRTSHGDVWHSGSTEKEEFADVHETKNPELEPEAEPTPGPTPGPTPTPTPGLTPAPGGRDRERNAHRDARDGDGGDDAHSLRLWRWRQEWASYWWWWWRDHRERQQQHRRHEQYDGEAYPPSPPPPPPHNYYGHHHRHRHRHHHHLHLETEDPDPPWIVPPLHASLALRAHW